MKSRAAGLMLGIASACLVVAIVAWDVRAASPGAISAVHADSAHIDQDDCGACHGETQSDMATTCARCHAAVAQQVAAQRGFHGRIEDVARCGRCHGEHHGAGFELAGAGAFALAGVTDRAAYAHAGLAFELGGVHATLACAACHEHADDALLPAGARRFLGESQACASCHDDPHAGRLADCRSCHGESEPFARVAEFEHPDTFALAGVHARAACVDCHPRGSEHAIEAGGGERATRAARGCEACHESPHAETFAAHPIAPSSDARSCAECHPTSGGRFADATLTDAQHAERAGFALAPPHAAAACTDCHARLAAPDAHGGAFAQFRAAHPGRSPDECAACHADPHGGQFADDAGAQRCLDCHAREHFEPPSFDAADHAAAGFALDGAHTSAACHACHARFEDGARVFRGTLERCADCHADAHGGHFARHTADAAADDCATCHTTASFARAADAEFDHARWTGFELAGRHATAECASCHARRERPDANGRAFGLVAERFPGSPDSCATCHVDAHAGRFAREAGCAACHVPHGFELAAAGFDHTAWTGFALDGAHARASCARCHPQSDGSALRATIHAGAGSYADCATCHADVHAGAFDRVGPAADGAQGCARCHTTSSFGELRPGGFDHAAWTDFALTGEHARAECASCHAGGARAGFARAPGQRCADCHADPHAGQFARAGATDCARCHATAPDFRAAEFDHARDARFALDATHARLDCAACHVRWPLPGGGTAVRYKPLGVVCGDCHDPRAGGTR